MEKNLCLQNVPELKDGAIANSGNGVVEPASPLNNESFGPPNESYYRPVYQQDICMWSNFHPDFHKVQQNQWNGFESFSSLNREYNFPVGGRVQYLPFRNVLSMLSARVPISRVPVFCGYGL
ncbi:hypothetical protein IFM89_037581 [Coptis chinensis]|uniref:Uncharacterized protein n=1 Tax=Coptis chinensis TaxID=261450 RepID=A0A835HBA7_9MAGN|nr:hypothetical protein IFM89_037581 [Coptis chinensis]